MNKTEYTKAFKFIKKIFPKLIRWLEQIPDARDENLILYDLEDILFLTVLLFLFRSPSLSSFEKEFRNNGKASKNLDSIFKMYWIPSDDTFRYALKSISTRDMNELLRKLSYRLERQKKLKPLLFQGEYYLIALDGTGQISSYKRHCEYCLTRTKDNKTLYMHYVLNAALTDINTQTSLSLAYEPITNADRKGKGFDKNDCEINAAKRLLANMKKMYPKRKFCFLGDNLYAVKPVLKLLLMYGWHFIMTAKPDRNKELFRNFEVLGETGNTLSVKDKNGTWHEYIWANAIPITQEYHEKDFFYVNFVEYFEYDEKGERIYHSSWITDFSITKSNVQEIAKGGRARFSIENRSFNEQKRNGYRLNHNFGHRGNLPSVFYGLIQVAHIISELFSKWNPGKFLIKQVGSKRRFFERLGTLLSGTILPEHPIPIIYIKLQWDTS